MKRGHIPIRLCVGCRTRRPAHELIRFSVSENSIVVSPQKRKIPGRGCYICLDHKCLEAALKKGVIARALRRQDLLAASKEALLQGLKLEGKFDDDDNR